MASRTTLIRKRYIQQFHEYGFLLCGICGLGISSANDISVDHILPKSKKGSNRVENLQPAHKVCNEKKANIEHEGVLNPWEL